MVGYRRTVAALSVLGSGAVLLSCHPPVPVRECIVTTVSVVANPADIDVGGQSTLTASLTTQNCGNDVPTPTWSSTGSSGVVQLSATTGTSITVTGLAQGNAPVTATAGGKSGQASVSVTPRPRIALSRTLIAFTAVQNGTLPASETFSITNSGGGTLSGVSAIDNISYGPDANGWLSSVLQIGTVAPVTVTVPPNTTNLPPGTYTATIGVTSPVASNSPQNVSITYQVTATPTGLGFSTPPPTSAQHGVPLSTSPVIQLLDATGQPAAVPGVQITASLVSSFAGALGGTLTATTGANGAASFASNQLAIQGVTEGGTYLLRFAATLNSQPVILTSAAITLACPASVISVGPLMNGSLTAGDCQGQNDGSRDYFTLSLASSQTVSIALTSSAFAPRILFRDPVGKESLHTGETVPLILPAGSHRIIATSDLAGGSGAYSIQVNSAPTDATNCSVYIVFSGVSTAQQLGTDCVNRRGTILGSGTFYGDRFAVLVEAGQVLTATLTSSTLDAYLYLVDLVSGAVLAEDDDGAGGNNSRIVFSPTVTGFFNLEPTSFDGGITGSYVLTVQLAPPSVGPAPHSSTAPSMRPHRSTAKVASPGGGRPSEAIP